MCLVAKDFLIVGKIAIWVFCVLIVLAPFGSLELGFTVIKLSVALLEDPNGHYILVVAEIPIWVLCISLVVFLFDSLRLSFHVTLIRCSSDYL